MKFLGLLIAITLLNSSIVQAKPNIYIKANDDFFTKFYLVKANKEVQVGQTEELLNLFKDNDISYQYAKDYDRYHTNALISIWSGLGLSLAYLLSSNSDDYSPGIYWGIFVTGAFTSIWYSGKAARSFHKAINTYNTVPETLSMNSSQRNNAPRLRYSWSF